MAHGNKPLLKRRQASLISSFIVPLESQYRREVDTCFSLFPKTTEQVIKIEPEVSVEDIRQTATTLTRQFDLVISDRIKRYTFIVEFKKDAITKNTLIECLLERGYYDLGSSYFHDFAGIVFVGSSVSGTAKVSAKKIKRFSKYDSMNIAIMDYQTFISHWFDTYASYIVSEINSTFSEKYKPLALQKALFSSIYNLNAISPDWFSSKWKIQKRYELRTQLLGLTQN
ncbi:MAG: hypothetical protein F6J98_01945 [Moorea sp. SIO4G2]|nr:hypothetical protein [Moorena sp. SIO4G2]